MELLILEVPELVHVVSMHYIINFNGSFLSCFLLDPSYGVDPFPAGVGE